MTTRYFIYCEVPGAHPSWTVAMLATSRTDANHAMKTHWGGGKFVCEKGPGNVKADCGDITEMARQEIASKLEDEWEEYQSTKNSSRRKQAVNEEVGDDDER